VREKAVLIGLAILHFTLSLAYGLVVPPWETPDEPAHFLYARYLSDFHQLPPPSSPQRGHYWEGYAITAYEWHHPPVYYILDALILEALKSIDSTWLPTEFPPFNPLFPAHSSVLFLPERAGFLNIAPDQVAIYVLRALSAFLGVFAVLATYGLSKAIFPQDEALALGAAGLAAFIPQVTFLNGSIRNDTLANALAGLELMALLWAVKAPDAGAERRSLFLAGTALAIGLMTKLTLLFLLPVAVLALLVRIRFVHSRRSFWQPCAWFCVPLLAILGLFYVLAPGAGAGTLHNLTPEIRVGQMPWASWDDFFIILTHSFWGYFGWLSLPIPNLLRDLLNAMAFMGWGGALTLWSLGRRSHSLDRFQSNAILILFAAVLFLIGSVIRFNFSYWQPQGRFLFPALPALAVLVLWGLLGATRKWLQRTGALLIVGSLLVFNLWCLAGFLFPTYHQSPLVSAFQDYSNTPVGEIWGSTTHGQTFACRYPNLARIDVMLATYARQNHHPLVFHLREAPSGVADLVTITVPAEDIADNTYYSFTFEPLPDSAGRTYYFYFEAPEAVPGDAFTIWADLQGDPYTSGTRYVNHAPAPGDLRFIAFSTQTLPGSKP